jgi:hypothetical protein
LAVTKGLMNGFIAARRALVCAAAAAALLAPTTARAEPIDRMHPCGKVLLVRFKAELAIQGTSCRRARPLLRGWLAESASLAGEGLPRSTRPRHWRCRRALTWSCTVNRRRVRMIFKLELRRHGDLLGTIAANRATAPWDEPYVDYRIVVRNVGTDPVMGRVAVRLPADVALVRTAPTQGRCEKPDRAGRMECALGWVATGFDRGAVVTIRVTYACSTFDPIAPAGIVVSSVAGDLDRSNNRAAVDELDRDCPDPFDAWWSEPDPDPPPEDPEPPVEDPPPPPDQPPPGKEPPPAGDPPPGP